MSISSLIQAKLSGQPYHLIYFVTARCNLACSHCLLQDAPKAAPADTANSSQELSLTEIERLAASLPPLAVLTLSGGEPFMRDDFGELCRIFVASNKIKDLRIVSNGWFQERICALAEKLLAGGLPRLTIRISLDGPAAVHDRIRGRGGSHARALATIARLKAIAAGDERLCLGSITTFQEANRQELAAYLPILRQLGLATTSLVLARGHAKPRAGFTREYAGLHRLYQAANKGAFRRAYKELSLQLQLRTLSAPCQAGRLLAVLRENGELFACEPLARPLAHLREFDLDFNAAWSSPAAKTLRELLATADDLEACKNCTYDCVLPFNIVAAPSLLARLLRERISSGIR